MTKIMSAHEGGGRVERRCWVNFQCRGVLLLWMIVGQGPIALAIGAGGGLFGHFFSHLSFLFSFSRETARYRLKYCLKGPLNPKQPTNQPAHEVVSNDFSETIGPIVPKFHMQPQWVGVKKVVQTVPVT